MPTLNEETARSFRTAQLQKRRWQRCYDAYTNGAGERFEQLLMAGLAATEMEFRQASRRCFDMHDRLASSIIPREGESMTPGQKLVLLQRAEWHRKIAHECRSSDVEHAAMHQRLAGQLADLARHGMSGGQPKAAEPAPEAAVGKKPIKRSYL